MTGSQKNKSQNRHLALLLLLLLTGFGAFSQIQVAAGYSACPNQPAVVTPSWNNVGNISYTLNSPPNTLPVSGGLPPFTTSFNISSSSTIATCVNFTLLGSGTSSLGPITSSAVIQLCIFPPAALTMTNNTYYCPGDNAIVTAPIGGNSYILNGPAPYNNLTFNTSILTMNNLPAATNGVYTVTSVGSCTATGTFTINTAPNTPLTISQPVHVCQGAAVTLSASIPNAPTFNWFDQFNTPVATNSSTYGFIGSAATAGVYKCVADYTFGIQTDFTTCPRSATTQVFVVSTNPVNVTASPSNVLCQGDKLSFSAIAGGEIGWSWSGPQSFAASISNPNINPAQSNNSGSYTVIALFTNGVITCTTANSLSVTVIPVNQPVITLPPSVCEDANVVLSANAPGSFSYSWSGPNYLSSGPTVTIANVKVNNAGLYYVTAKFSINNVQCSSTNSAQLNVIPVNTISIIPSPPVCQPGNANLQCSAIGANSYLWVGPNNFQSPGSNAIVYFPTPSASGVYTVTAFFTGVNITCSSTNTVQVTVNPILTFSLIPWQRTCYNTSLSVIGPPGATGYKWTSSTGFVATTKDISFSSVQPNNSGTYTLEVSLGPCVTSGSTIIEVLTPVQYTLSPQNRSICRGDTTVLEVGVSGGSENYAYVWNPSVFMDNPIGAVKKIAPIATVVYNVVAHDIACPNYTIGHSFTVNVNQPPIPDLQLSRTEGCAPFVEFYDSKTGAGDIITYDYGAEKKFQQDRREITLKDPGTYTLDIHTKGTNGCGGVFRFPYPITVHPKPNTTIFWSPELPTTNDEVTFYYSVENGPVTKHLWSFSGGAPAIIDTTIKPGPGSDTSIVNNPVRRYEQIGNYPIAIVLINEKGCVDTVLKEMNVTDDFRIYVPNCFTPNGDGLNDSFGVKGSGIRLEGFTLEIMDRWGNRIFVSKDINEWWDGKLGGKTAVDGTYTYRVRAVGLNGEGRKEFVGHFTILK